MAEQNEIFSIIAKNLRDQFYLLIQLPGQFPDLDSCNFICTGQGNEWSYNGINAFKMAEIDIPEGGIRKSM